MGFGNTIINYGTILSNTSSAIFLQNSANPTVYSSTVNRGNTSLPAPGDAFIIPAPPGTPGASNTTFGTVIENFGTITSELPAGASQSTRALQAIAETANTAQNVFFANEVGAMVNGNVNMGNGNDTVELFSASEINGNPGANNLPALSAGSGFDTLILNGLSGVQPTGQLGGSLLGFNVLTKIGDGPWVITGVLDTSKGSLTAEVAEGTLILSGNTPTFSGTMTVDGPGTLQIGNGGTSGSFGANISDNGIVAFDRSDTLTYSNAISGTGQVGQIGTGRTILTGTNTYTGGTFINNGTLQVAADANLGNAAGPLTFGGNGGTLNTTASFTSARATTLNATGTFDVNPATTLTMTGVIGGPAALTKTDTGTLVLTGTNIYGGGTNLNGGTLTLGNANALGTGTLAMAAGTTLDFLGSYTVVNADTLSGDPTINVNTGLSETDAGAITNGTAAGALNKTGSGTLVLTSEDTYTAGTMISAGTLQLGDGGTSGSIIGDVADQGTLAFDRSDVVTFPGSISGAGAVNQIGSGTTVLTANNVYSGLTNVEAGTLAAGVENAFSPNSVHIVDPGGTLDLMGFDQEVPGVENEGTIYTHGDPNTQLIVNGSYVGNNGLLVLNTYLASDDSPSDKLVINGRTATGTTGLRIDNVGGPGAETFENGIPVVITENGATTDDHAFELVDEVRAGAFTYDLFRGGVEGTNPQDYFLRNTFIVPEQPRA
jgi:autotransporter-associated beta strand protein